MMDERQQSFSPVKRRLAALILVIAAAVAAVADLGEVWNRVAPAGLHTRGYFKEPYRLGLDLQGGTHLVYRADLAAIADGERSEAMRGLRDVIDRRVNFLGVSEPTVEVNRVGDDWRLIVELAGVKNVEEAVRLIGQTPFLEFREMHDATTTQIILKAQENQERLDEDPYFSPGGALTGRYLNRAELNFDKQTNVPIISLQFNDEGAKLFEEITARNIGKPVGIYLDGNLRSAPNVNETISGGRAVITGKFSVKEAQSIVRDLNSGALPVPISLMSQQSVEASLGRISLISSLKAGLIGLAIVGAFMLVWYRFPGLLAVLALLIYTSLSLFVFRLVGVTFSVAAIAGFILSIGMAVDANILIFERIKEELKSGKPLAAAIPEGFARAWTSIRDSNVSSLITAGILYWLGTSAVRGFATTLALGIGVSMFTALTVTRTFLLATLIKRAPRWLYLSGFSIK